MVRRQPGSNFIAALAIGFFSVIAVAMQSENDHAALGS
jgi:hypothetical protein